MAKLADAADLKSADSNRSWGFDSPSGHHPLTPGHASFALTKASLAQFSQQITVNFLLTLNFHPE